MNYSQDLPLFSQGDFSFEELLQPEEESSVSLRLYDQDDMDGLANFSGITPKMEMEDDCDFTIETLEMQEPGEDVNTLISLPGKGDVKLPRVPMTNSELDTIPNKFPGPFSFALNFPNDTKGKPIPRAAPFTHSCLSKKLYMQTNVRVAFHLSTSDPLPPGTMVRVRPRYIQTEHKRDPVKRCPNHVEQSLPHGMHLMKVSVPSAHYEFEPTRHLSVVFPWADCEVGENDPFFELELFCFSSCVGGLNRRPFELTVSLEHSSRILGCDTIETRSCACPGRDRASDEKKILGGGRRKKPKRQMKSLASQMSLSQDDDQIHTLQVQGRTKYEVLRHIVEGLNEAKQVQKASRTGLPHTLSKRKTSTISSNTEKRRSTKKKKKIMDASDEVDDENAGDTEPESDGDDDYESQAAISFTPQSRVRHAFLTKQLGEAVKSWLGALLLSQYTSNFLDNGFDDLEVVSDITDEDLSALSITLPGHRKKLSLAVKRLRALIAQAKMEEKQGSMVRRVTITRKRFNRKRM
eukprot:m.27392 g.27392  ORF g.27392 m.27392 type:complete len:521 (+) comp5936_c0_seq1:36-1598(+)